LGKPAGIDDHCRDYRGRHQPSKTPAMTFAEKIEAAEGRPSGFDYLRIGLSLSVIFIHVPQVVYGWDVAYPFWIPWLRPISAMVVPMFFALSGFLVAGSMLRSKTLVTFFGLRVLRIAPALSVEVTLSALILGPIFTNLPLKEYFTDLLFFRYFYNLIGHVQFSLPGVFASNPFPDQVNSQLWTIPPELKCYILMGLMSLCLVFRSRLYLLAVAIGFNALVFIFYHGLDEPGRINVPPMAIVGAFLAGVTLFMFRDRIPARFSLFVVCLLGCIALLYAPGGDYFIAFPVAYVTVYLGTFNPVRHGGDYADYSYGIYLYGFPIQQAVTSLTGPYRSWYLDLCFVLPLTFAVAALSWHFIEKPALRLRVVLPHLEAIAINLMRRLRLSAS
jgi:peptidoglycan/LPS O-acetylase OafA/YrhL